MSRRVRRRASQSKEKGKVLPILSYLKTGGGNTAVGEVDWTSLPDDIVVQHFSCLNYHDRSSLTSTCRSFLAPSASAISSAPTSSTVVHRFHPGSSPLFTTVINVAQPWRCRKLLDKIVDVRFINIILTFVVEFQHTQSSHSAAVMPRDEFITQMLTSGIYGDDAYQRSGWEGGRESSVMAMSSTADGEGSIVRRDGIVLFRGPYIPLKTGRRDERRSRAEVLDQYLPDHNESILSVLDKFGAMGIDTAGVVSLLGAHSVGWTHCVKLIHCHYLKVDPEQNKLMEIYILPHKNEILELYEVYLSACSP